MPSTGVPASRGEDEGRGHPGATQPLQVAGHMLGTGDDDEVGSAQVVDDPHPGDRGDLLQRHELVEVRRVGATDDRHPPTGPRVAEHGRTLFGGEAMVEPRDHPDGGHTGGRLQVGRRRRQQVGVAPELVEDEPLDAPLPGGWEQRPGTEQVGEGAPAIDVGHQRHRSVDVVSHRHVHDVAGPQIGLGGATGPLDDDHVELVGERGQCLGDSRPQPGRAIPPRLRRQLVVDHAAHHHLAAGLALGLEEHRIHAHVRVDARRPRL